MNEGELTDGEDEPETFNDLTQVSVADAIKGNDAAANTKYWGMLYCKGNNQEFYLEHRVKDGFKDRYILGRHSSCDIQISDKRISSRHCAIYCDYEESRLRVFLEDTSVNGTFVNDSLTRLHKGVRVQLRSGDDIYLVNPRYQTNGSEFNKMASFMFINMRERMMTQRALGKAPVVESTIARPFVRHIEDDYVIGDEIGKGMCGVVCLCTHRTTGRQCAVKIIDTNNFALTPGLSVKELREEAQIMKTLAHKNIVKIYDTFETGHVIYIVMELVRGGDLFDSIVMRGRYSEEDAKKVMRQVMSAVQYLHSNEIIHRDLKPENILLMDKSSDSNDDEVRISDFGLAKRTTQDGLKTFCGTPQYFAPEVLRRRNSVTGAGRYGKAADMWSLGVILYILLSGTFPFDEDCLFDQIAGAQYNMDGVEWLHISPLAKDLIKKLMTLMPHERLLINSAINHKWFSSDAEVSGIEGVGSPSRSKESSLLKNQCAGSDDEVEYIKTNIAKASAPVKRRQQTLFNSVVFNSATANSVGNEDNGEKLSKKRSISVVKSKSVRETKKLKAVHRSSTLHEVKPEESTKIIQKTSSIWRTEIPATIRPFAKPELEEQLSLASPSTGRLAARPTIGTLFNSASRSHSALAIQSSLMKSSALSQSSGSGSSGKKLNAEGKENSNDECCNSDRLVQFYSADSNISLAGTDADRLLGSASMQEQGNMDGSKGVPFFRKFTQKTLADSYKKAGADISQSSGAASDEKGAVEATSKTPSGAAVPKLKQANKGKVRVKVTTLTDMFSQKA